MSLFNLHNRVVVVTGGLGQLARQFTRALVSHGARVAIIDLPGRTTAVDADPDRVILLAADVRDRSALADARKSIERRWETPFGLVNNAAVDIPPDASAEESGPLEDYPLSAWQRVFDVNMAGAVMASQVFGSGMADAGRGAIVNISSIYGLVSPDQRIYRTGQPETPPFYKPAAYGASKAALLNFTRYASTYWAPRGVRVNALALGGVFNHQPEAFVQAYASRVPMGRMARDDEYNGALVFLLSDAASYMTGAVMVVDGGWTTW